MQALNHAGAVMDAGGAYALVAVAAGVFLVGVALWLGRKGRGGQSASAGAATLAEAKPAEPPVAREADAIYQKNRVVGRVVGVEVDEAAQQVRFGEISNSDSLLLADECEFRQYKVLVQEVEFAARIDKVGADKGRVLRGVTAAILGYREQ